MFHYFARFAWFAFSFHSFRVSRSRSLFANIINAFFLLHFLKECHSCHIFLSLYSFSYSFTRFLMHRLLDFGIFCFVSLSLASAFSVCFICSFCVIYSALCFFFCLLFSIILNAVIIVFFCLSCVQCHKFMSERERAICDSGNK